MSYGGARQEVSTGFDAREQASMRRDVVGEVGRAGGRDGRDRGNDGRQKHHPTPEPVLHHSASRHLRLGGEVLRAGRVGAHVVREVVIGFFVRRSCHPHHLRSDRGDHAAGKRVAEICRPRVVMSGVWLPGGTVTDVPFQWVKAATWSDFPLALPGS